MYLAIVYHPEYCPKCMITKKALSDKVNVEEVLVNDEIRDLLRSQGFQSFPVVKLFHNEDKVDTWSDLQMGKIKHWNGVIESGKD